MTCVTLRPLRALILFPRRVAEEGWVGPAKFKGDDKDIGFGNEGSCDDFTSLLYNLAPYVAHAFLLVKHRVNPVSIPTLAKFVPFLSHFPLALVVVFLAPFILSSLQHDKNRVMTCRSDVGFPALPNELYSEILSHLYATPIPQSAYLNVTIDPGRHVTLFALSQTCKSLRSFFLRHAWDSERIEVFHGMWTPTGRLPTKYELFSPESHKRGPFHAKFVTETRRQFEMVTVRNPDLAQYVHFITIYITDSPHKTIILSQLAKILSLLPHVHTLQINPWGFMPDVDFSQYPQIQTLCLRGPDLTCDKLFLACPNLTSFTQYDCGVCVLRPLRSCSSHLHMLGIITIQFPTKELATCFPHLREITVDHTILKEDLSPLSSLPLHTLRLCLTIKQGFSGKRTFNPSAADYYKWIASAKTILKKCPTHGSGVIRKQVVVITNCRLVESYPV